MLCLCSQEHEARTFLGRLQNGLGRTRIEATFHLALLVMWLQRLERVGIFTATQGIPIFALTRLGSVLFAARANEHLKRMAGAW